MGVVVEPLVGLGRFELPTSRLSVVCSDQLSYKPVPTHGALVSTCIELAGSV
jgi:hypothetical protein